MILRNFKGAFRWLGGKGVITFNNFPTCQAIQPFITMTSSSYERAVTALNGLQSNAAYLQKARVERSSKADKNLTVTKQHLQTLNITLEDIDSLNIIHVAGTKGKGSTCAFTESILRNYGCKTGFYSSPHLISVNERIRINGTALPKDKFADYFWEVYNNIKDSLKDDENMPSYFLFLTVMAFYVFVKEQVEAAVIEVGIGGLYDCTNIVRKPVAVGITTLGIDHVHLLGNTITEIAKQKAGIMKPGVPAFTVPQQENAMKILREKAQSIGCSLFLSPPLESYEGLTVQTFGIQGLVQGVNASLALQLSHRWLTSTKCSDSNSLNVYNSSEKDCYTSDLATVPLTMGDTFYLNSKTQKALENCIWPGRFQVVEKNRVTFYLDGAHTQQSIKYCGKWFDDLSQSHQTKYQSPVIRVLYFNCTGDRKAETLLDPLSDLPFDIVIFSPNKIDVIKETSSDLSNFMVDPEQEMQQCITNKEIWCHLMRSLYENEISLASNASKTSITNCECNNTVIFPSITDALNFVTSSHSHFNSCQSMKANELSNLVNEASHIQILVTGSLHLVGGVLSLIQS